MAAATALAPTVLTNSGVKSSVVKVGASGGGLRVVAPKGDAEARGKNSYWLEGL